MFLLVEMTVMNRQILKKRLLSFEAQLEAELAAQEMMAEIIAEEERAKRLAEFEAEFEAEYAAQQAKLAEEKAAAEAAAVKAAAEAAAAEAAAAHEACKHTLDLKLSASNIALFHSALADGTLFNIGPQITSGTEFGSNRWDEYAECVSNYVNPF